VIEVASDAPPAVSVAPTADIATDTAALWRDILVAVRDGSPMILSFLEAGTLAEVTATHLKIVFPEGQDLPVGSLMRPKNRAVIEKLAERLTGRALALECELRPGLVVEPVALPTAEPPPPPADPMEEFKNDPLIRKALDLFQAEIQLA
jgi:DNA polymerase-3 subunit gamma/tau